MSASVIASLDLSNVTDAPTEMDEIQIPITADSAMLNQMAAAYLEEEAVYNWMIALDDGSHESFLTGTLDELITRKSFSVERRFLIKAIISLPEPEDGPQTPTDAWVEAMAVVGSTVHAVLTNGTYSVQTMDVGSQKISTARTVKLSDAPLKSVAVFHEKTRDLVMTGGLDRQLRQIAVAKQTISPSSIATLDQSVTAVELITSSFGVVGCSDGTLLSFSNGSAGFEYAPFADDTTRHSQAITAIAVATPWVCTASMDGSIKQWYVDPSPSAGPVPATLIRTMRSSSAVLSLAVRQSVDNLLLLSGQSDCSTRVWQLPHPVSGGDPPAVTVTRMAGGHTGPVSACRFVSSQGQPFLVTGGFDCSVLFWDLRSHDAPVHRRSVPARVLSLAVVKEGNAVGVMVGTALDSLQSFVLDL